MTFVFILYLSTTNALCVATDQNYLLESGHVIGEQMTKENDPLTWNL